MKRLFLGVNKLENLPVEIKEMTKLVELDVRKNELTAVPEELGECAMLEHLNLGHNKIPKLPEDLLTKLPLLRELYLYGNKLETLPLPPESMVNMEKLR